jgi:hypothetical protein
MKLIIGLVGGFFVMGAVGGLETDAMTIMETLMYSVVGVSMCGFALSDIEVG